MGRWTDDDACVPSGMQRIGYDSDTQRYTFRDSDGCIYEGGTSGGDLVLVSRPTVKSKSKQDDEPIRLMPNSPTRSSHTVTASPATPTSPMSFRDFLPPDAMTGATPQEAPRRRVTMKMPSSSALQRAQTSPRRDTTPQRSLWNVVRSKTAPTKMRDIVHNVVRRSSKSKDIPPNDRRYELLSDSSRTSPSPSRHSKYPTA
ncbi:hypothetical protein PHLGIDRAFT_28382 [Phlebiopsis gigantea 11061_1 CR5-6]|uniref:Carbohydrate-binding module family 50 protein n=1 Tax=Phlebiopsis gigantea (strain 11061_1 CR5-6) TaxID=745531 RepID=A0A0C3SEI9_PHLG1|nr:hypothetical protein PHLGIDRAFT_28382 [Phlebiopsis gigantea 11061_1 CR5-6]